MSEKIQTLEGVLSENERRRARFVSSSISQLVLGGDLEKETKREVFLACIQHFSINFQTIMLTRQALCADPRYARIFREHLREEIDHDELITQRAGSRETDDAMFVAISAWFSYQMVILDNVEKGALVHLVLEEAADYFFTLTEKTVDKYVPGGYFKTHAQLDEGHAALGKIILDDQSPHVYARVLDVVTQGWDMIDAAAERVVFLVGRTE